MEKGKRLGRFLPKHRDEEGKKESAFPAAYTSPSRESEVLKKILHFIPNVGINILQLSPHGVFFDKEKFSSNRMTTVTFEAIAPKIRASVQTQPSHHP